MTARTTAPQHAESAHTAPTQGVPRELFFQDAFKGARKRTRTRARIVDCAIGILSEKGIDRTSIVEIAESAGLSNGSFYYHFKDKEELLEAVGGMLAAIFVYEINLAIADVTSGVERVAIATQLFVRRAAEAPHWGGLVVHAMTELGEFRDQISLGIQHDVRIGIDQGLFSLPPTPAVFAMLLGVVGTAVNEALRDPIGNADAGVLASQIILQALGVAEAEARNVTKSVSTGLPHIMSGFAANLQNVIGDFA